MENKFIFIALVVLIIILMYFVFKPKTISIASLSQDGSKLLVIKGNSIYLKNGDGELREIYTPFQQ